MKAEVENICEGQNLTISLSECTVCEQPFNWTLDDQPLPVDIIVGDGGLMIPTVDSYHYGMYNAVPTVNRRCRKRAFKLDMCKGMYLVDIKNGLRMDYVCVFENLEYEFEQNPHKKFVYSIIMLGYTYLCFNTC